MEKLLTTNDVAMAIGASESSLRRWTNSGVIRTSRTVGGHRRIPVAEAIRFIRESGATVVRPDLLGLDEIGSPGDASGVVAAVPDEQRLFDALGAGERRVAGGLILSWYLAGRTLADLFDGPIRAAMHRVGD